MLRADTARLFPPVSPLPLEYLFCLKTPPHSQGKDAGGKHAPLRAKTGYTNTEDSADTTASGAESADGHYAATEVGEELPEDELQCRYDRADTTTKAAKDDLPSLDEQRRCDRADTTVSSDQPAAAAVTTDSGAVAVGDDLPADYMPQNRYDRADTVRRAEQVVPRDKR